MQPRRAVRNRTTGVLYVLDEPSIGLHPANIAGLNAVMHDLISDGNSVLLVDHDAQILSEADWIIEMGPQAGAEGGRVVAEGTVDALIQTKLPRSGRFFSGAAPNFARRARRNCFRGAIRLSTAAIHTVKPLEVRIPKGAHRRHRRIRLRQKPR